MLLILTEEQAIMVHSAKKYQPAYEYVGKSREMFDYLVRIGAFKRIGIGIYTADKWALKQAKYILEDGS